MDALVTSAAATVCLRCGSPVLAGDRFCVGCGQPVTAAPTSASRPGPLGPSPTPCTGCGATSVGKGDGYCPACGTRWPAPRDHLEDTDGRVAAVSDCGRRRENEDAFAISSTLDGQAFAVVCDGVSTTPRSAEASQEAAASALAALVGTDQQVSAVDRLVLTYDAARKAVARLVDREGDDETGAPSCTFLAADVSDHGVELLSVGDCRAFWLPDDGMPLTLTQDDSWATEQILAGAMTTEQAYADPRSHIITRWLSADADFSWRPAVVSFEPPGSGRLVLCSDGLWHYAASASAVAVVAAAVARHSDEPLALARGLVDFANRQGGHDNITAVVVDLLHPRSPAAGPKGSS